LLLAGPKVGRWEGEKVRSGVGKIPTLPLTHFLTFNRVFIGISDSPVTITAHGLAARTR
jgi:hypothetical protein